jgi:hypothetical protein
MQTQNATMSVQELRQVLVDLGSYIDAHKNTRLAAKFAALTDQSLETILPAVQDPWGLQKAVTSLKESGGGRTTTTKFTPRAQLAVQPDLAFPSCTAGTIIDNSPGAVCTPAYPDPTNSAWQAMVNPLITFGAFSPTDYPSVSSQGCALTVESNLSTVVSAMQGLVEASTPICSIIPAPFDAACWAPVAALSIAGAVSTGLLSDCSEQDGNVNTAEIDAAFHNTVTIYDSLGAVNNQITEEFNNLSTQVAGVDTHLTNVDNHVAAEFAALNANLLALFNQLSTQGTNSTALENADLRQVMKLELTPDGQKVIDPPILTCTGTNCPNVLAKCPAAGCAWNNAGRLP